MREHPTDRARTMAFARKILAGRRLPADAADFQGDIAAVYATVVGDADGALAVRPDLTDAETRVAVYGLAMANVERIRPIMSKDGRVKAHALGFSAIKVALDRMPARDLLALQLL